MMIRQVTSELKNHYNNAKYYGGFMSRVSLPEEESHKYDVQILEQYHTQNLINNMDVTQRIRRRYKSKIPILKAANWRLFHELLDVHQLLQHMKKQIAYNKSIYSILEKITTASYNHGPTPSLIMEFFGPPCAIKAIERTPPLPIHSRSEHFNPVQLVIGTLVARKMINPISNEHYQPVMQRAKLTPNNLCREELDKYGAAEAMESLPTYEYISNMRKEEYKRHYKLDPDHWYVHWPKNRHEQSSKLKSVQRFIYTISENDHWYLASEYYQKQAPNTWTLAPPERLMDLVNNELRERDKLARAIYSNFFQLTH